MSPHAGKPSESPPVDTCRERRVSTVGPQEDRPAEEALTTRLLEELNAAWQGGERLRADDLLARHPEARAQTEVGVRVVYEEVCLREETGEQVDPTEVLHRFPHWRDQLEILLDCHGLMRPAPGPIFPAVGEVLDGLRLLAELGRGRQGRVFLATQPALADRPVVLKLTPQIGREHSSLAQLQHTYIVPLYWVQDFPDRHLRLLGMPYLGGATLAQILDGLRDRPVAQRSGRDLLAALDAVQAQSPLSQPAHGPARELLRRSSWVEAICWVGACLAEALDYAHQRGLVHLDLKPSNVLIASDGQPLLLDFHLAREPLSAGKPAPDWFGGTPAYMAPEQRLAWAAIEAARPLPGPVDGRADIHALGHLLHEALGGRNPDVSPGLADVVHKCLAVRPDDRYPHAGALAADLRRHLTDQPLKGVPNRNLLERWRKWRRRRPLAVPLALLLAVIMGLGFLAWSSVQSRVGKDLAQARESLQEGERLLEEGKFSHAVDRLKRGHDLAAVTPGGDALAQDLEEAVNRGRRGQTARRLHDVVERLGFAVVDPSLPSKQAQELEARCRSLWERRDLLLRHKEPGLGLEAEQRLQTDLLDLVVIWTTLRVRLASGPEEKPARRAALAVLAEAEKSLGPSPVLEQERRTHATALGSKKEATRAEQTLAQLPARTAWEHYALGRSFLLEGKLDKAAEEFEGGLASSPQHFWSHFYLGKCCYRLKHYEEASEAFGACVALSPQSAECYHNRALAYAARGDTKRALRDYNRALELSPTLAEAVYNRGLLHDRADRYAEAEADLRRALELNPRNAAARALLEHVRKKAASAVKDR